jgi:membrane protein
MYNWAAKTWQILRETFQEWREDKVPRLGAALAYYSIFSLAPLLIIAVTAASWFYREDAIRGQLAIQLEGLLGRQGATMVEQMINNVNTTGQGRLATWLGIAALLFGATGAVVALKDAMNTIWGVMPSPDRGWWGTIRDRLLSLAIVLAVGFLLLTSLVLTAVLNALSALAVDWIPAWLPQARLTNLFVSFVVITLLFAMIFKWLPDVIIGWRDVWVGAVITALLFMAGKELIGMYLGRAGPGSAYGAAGSLVIVLLWTYYSAQILFLGAEFTQVYARRKGSRTAPRPGAMLITEASLQCKTASRKHERQAEKGRPDDKATRGQGER